MSDFVRSEEQLRAADPKDSVWVTASAGSGKTSVLTDRVLNLLLEGVALDRILALTFTKTAAAEMHNRILGELALWSVADDAGLRRALAGLCGRTDGDTMRLARRLFFTIMESPEPLKIMTIHSFCQGLLSQFPFEAGVTPGSEVMDESEARKLANAAVMAAINRPARRDDVMALGGILAGRTLKEVLAAAFKSADDLDVPAIAEYLGAEVTVDEAVLAYRAEADATLREWSEALKKGTATDGKNAGLIDAWLAGTMDFPDFARGYFYTDKGPRKDLGGKAASPNMHDQENLRALTAETLARVRGLKLLSANAALKRVLSAVADEYAGDKRRRALLDYDDLIERAAALLTRSDVRDWVLYKLDYRIDHVLVDEAQDTSPAQWAIIAGLVEDFFAGHTRSESRRTLFVVGDRKQSIFSFQGADLKSFMKMRAHFGAQAGAAATFREIPLSRSYRSSQAILDFVNRMLEHPDYRTLGLEPADLDHRAHFERKSARIALWPREDGPEKTAMEPRLPIPRDPEPGPDDRLADRVVRTVVGLVKNGTLSSGRRIRNRDIMILVKSRNALALKIIRKLKIADVPVFGIDRLDLLKHQAVLDLLSVLRFIAEPLDDLALAEVLKGPLFKLTDDDLLRLCPGRRESLWQTLRANRDYAAVMEKLSDLLNRDHLRPFELLSGLLTDDLRRSLARRLGEESADIVDELLNLSLAFERANRPTLTAFLAWISGQDHVVKRDLDSGSVDAVRLMTVHAAKGLQAPVVILPNIAEAGRPSRYMRRNVMRAAERRPAVWLPKKEWDTEAVAPYIDDYDRASYEEYLRLFYVAVTRAEERLYMGALPGGEKTTWYDIAEFALKDVDPDKDGSRTLVYDGKESPERETAATEESSGFTEIPLLPLPEEAEEPKALTPSASAKRGDPEAIARGLAIHRLLELLPKGVPARNICADPKLAESAFRVLADPRVARFFGPGSLAEVPLVGMCDGRPVSGRIDRLAFAPDEALILDYKSARDVGDDGGRLSGKYLRQMDLYKRVLADIFPARSVRAFVLFTETMQLVEC